MALNLRARGCEVTGNAAKEQRRAELSAQREAMSMFAREQAAANLSEWVYSAPFRLEYDVTVAAYIPVGTEPGSLSFLDALADRDVRVLVPVVPDGEPTALDWITYDGQDSLETRRFGLLEPAGAPLGTGVLDTVDVVFVPALGVDRRGVRLGRGAGYYDRSLSGVDAELVAVVYDNELVDELPEESTDVRVGWALTPDGGFTELG
ncbi:5-formyltetrahydrofolate cyclo-ligase [Gordonia effusa]|uniref:5-formyltetrahydrofolate cyclo-ligase n=1 Tax=Gordonia effusa TaxID=263908 RepID=UPI0006821812